MLKEEAQTGSNMQSEQPCLHTHLKADMTSICPGHIQVRVSMGGYTEKPRRKPSAPRAQSYTTKYIHLLSWPQHDPGAGTWEGTRSSSLWQDSNTSSPVGSLVNTLKDGWGNMDSCLYYFNFPMGTDRFQLRCFRKLPLTCFVPHFPTCVGG